MKDQEPITIHTLTQQKQYYLIEGKFKVFVTCNGTLFGI